MAILSGGYWAVYNARKNEFVMGVEPGDNGKILTTTEPGYVQYFEEKEKAEDAMRKSKCGKCYKVVQVKLIVEKEELNVVDR